MPDQKDAVILADKCGCLSISVNDLKQQGSRRPFLTSACPFRDSNLDIPVLPNQVETPVLTGLHVSTPLRGKTICQGFPCDTKFGNVRFRIYALK